MLGMGHERRRGLLRRWEGYGKLRRAAAEWPGNRGYRHRILFSIWHRNWKLPECLHHADSGGDLDRFAGLAVPAVRDADKTARQRAGIFLAMAAGEMPGLRSANFRDVPAD